jgi:uncharacterized protein YceK
MKALCLVLLLGLSMSGCSRFTKSGRMDRAYYKQLKQVKAAREKQRKKTIQKRAEMPSLRNPPPPPLEQNVQPQPSPPPENQ